MKPAAADAGPRAGRARPVHALACGLVLLLGLASRRYPGFLPGLLGKYPGDVFWAMMVFFGWGALWLRAGPRSMAALALATCFAVEILKLYPTPWITGLRHTTLGPLVLGRVFSVGNLVAYAVGVCLALGVEVLWLRRDQRTNRPA